MTVKSRALKKIKWKVSFSQMNGPLWLMQSEAGLFWRAKGNGSQALQCLRQALHSTPPQHRDMPLVNTANLLLHYGLHEEAHDLLQQALQINRSEVRADTDLQWRPLNTTPVLVQTLTSTTHFTL